MRQLRATAAYRDPKAALRFFVEKCGFAPASAQARETGNAGDSAGAGTLVSRGGVSLRIVDQAAIPATSPLGRRLGKSPGSGIALEIVLEKGEKIEDWFVRLERAGCDIVEPLGRWRDSERSFTVADPGNYLICFVETA
jgi:catechol 2,3-dioxygenase-like lactoylglutathione lyase family enzyme